MTSSDSSNGSIDVAVVQTAGASYPVEPPFDPPEKYPELNPELWHLDPSNTVYAGVRETLRVLGLDAARYGTPAWNPMSSFVRPGDRVVIKPNLVRDFHGDGLGLAPLVTHGSVVRAILDYVILALGGRGSIIIGDSPLQYADFNKTTQDLGLTRILQEVKPHAGVPIRLVDFRRTKSEKRGGLIIARLPNTGDPEGYQVVDLKQSSRFAGSSATRCGRFRVTQYDPRTMRVAHNETSHAYLFPKSVLAADVVINLPKLKTHRKAGVTAAMKNLVGINGSKDWLPHHTAGSTADGGDEYLHPSRRKAMISTLRDLMEERRSAPVRRMLQLMVRALKSTGRIVPFADPYWEGSWHGNDTNWRMVHDLHRILFFADPAGVVGEKAPRRYFALVDAVVAGEGEGPMRPSPKAAGLLVAGAHPAAVDIVCARIMGFDEAKIPLLKNTIGTRFQPALPGLDAIRVVTNTPQWGRPFELAYEQTLKFIPPAGWAGRIERRR